MKSELNEGFKNFRYRDRFHAFVFISSRVFEKISDEEHHSYLG